MQEQKTNLTQKAFLYAVIFMVFHTIISLIRAQIGFMIPPLMTFIVKDLGISLAQGGMLQTTATVVMGVGMCFGSVLIDKIGSSKTLVISLLAMTVCGVLGGLAHSYAMLMTARIFMGLGNAFSYPAVMTIVAERFHTQKHRGMASSLIQATNSLSNTFAFSLTVPIFLALNQSWNNQMLMWGIFTLVLAIVFFLSDRKPDRFFAEYNVQRAQSAQGQTQGLTADEGGSSLLKAMKSKEVWCAVVSFTGATWLFMIYNIYLPTILKTVHNVSAVEAGKITSLLSLAGVVSCIITGLFLGKVKNFKPLIVTLMLLLPISGAIAMLLKPGLALNLCVILIGVSWSSYVPVINTAVMVSKGITPKIFAASNALWTLLGNVLSMLIPILFDNLQKQFGMQQAALLLCIGGVFAIGGALFYPSGKKATA